MNDPVEIPEQDYSNAVPSASVVKHKVREKIAEKAGDTASLLGTTADGAQLAIYGLAAICAKLATANSLAEVREAAEPFAQLSAGFLAKVESGEVVLPFMLKGLENTVADIETRATAVSDALQAAQKG
ncbi:MAG: hypothetical protein ACJAVZ_000081 [Afipia broomeae]|jgi:hypothetical protein